MTSIGALSAAGRGHPHEAAEGVMPAAVELLYQKHKDSVYRLALRYGSGRRAWAEDVVQDVFVAVLRDLRPEHGIDNIAAWLYRVTTNRCLKRLQRERLFGLIAALLKGTPAVERRTPERECDGSQMLAQVCRGFDRLPAKEKTVFAMRYLDDKSQTQIADVLGLSKGYVSKLLKRAETKLALLQDVHHG